MRIVQESGRCSATGEALVRALALLDETAPRPFPVGKSEGPDERDESGALPAGHPVSWGALWGRDDPPSYLAAVQGAGHW